MHIGIIGSGALACLFASRLHPHHKLTLIGSWPAQLAVLRRQGLTVVEMDGRQTHHILRVSDTPSQVAPLDVALVLVKSYQTGQAAERARRCLSSNGLCVTLQNGLGNREQLLDVLGGERVAVGSTAQGATLLSPGRIRHAGQGMTYLSHQAATLTPFLTQAGLATAVSDNVEGILWGKLLINIGINPLTALLGQPNGYLAEVDEARALLCRAVAEGAAVAQALGIRLPYANPIEQTLQVARTTAQNHSSMWQDVQRGSPTEIEAMTGQIVRYGRQRGVPTPTNEQLCQLVRTYTKPLSLETLNQALG